MYIISWQQARHTLQNQHLVTVVYIVYVIPVFDTRSNKKIFLIESIKIGCRLMYTLQTLFNSRGADLCLKVQGWMRNEGDLQDYVS